MLSTISPPLAVGISSGSWEGRGAGFSAHELAAWRARHHGRVPTHPRTRWERAADGDLPWLEQVAAEQAIDRATSPYAVQQLLDARDLAAEVERERGVRLGRIASDDYP